MEVDRTRQNILAPVAWLELNLHSITDTIEFLQGVLEKHGDGFLSIESHKCGDDIVVAQALRPETDEEMASRIRCEERRMRLLEAGERLEFERLKAKFG